MEVLTDNRQGSTDLRSGSFPYAREESNTVNGRVFYSSERTVLLRPCSICDTVGLLKNLDSTRLLEAFVKEQQIRGRELFHQFAIESLRLQRRFNPQLFTKKLAKRVVMFFDCPSVTKGRMTSQ